MGARLKGAETLETSGILPSITQFNTRRLNAALLRSDATGDVSVQDGLLTVVEGKRLLEPLFLTTEFNIGSSPVKSGLHPLPKSSTIGPAADVILPASFFLNSALLARGTPPNYVGLGISGAAKFSGVGAVRSTEYKQLVTEAGLELAGRSPADADFAWLTPEPSHTACSVVSVLFFMAVTSAFFVSAVFPGKTGIAPAYCLVKFWERCESVGDEIAVRNYTRPTPVKAPIRPPEDPVKFDRYRATVYFAGIILRQDVVAMSQKLAAMGWRVDQPDRGGERPPEAAGRNEVRYTTSEDESAAQALAGLVQESNVVSQEIKVRQVPHLSPRTLEVWMSR